ncbi:MAG: 2-oxo acid dehydrogenase subunit E2 [Chloroflexi bacterium]|nr:2-oxo acid dehydrogenase subunit E2 [Chloroflexota bacterium]
MPDSKQYEVVMPKLGLITTQATLVEWLKQEGDYVQKGEPLFSLESEKTLLEIEAPASGYLHILQPAGGTYELLTPLGTLSANAAGQAAMAASPLAAQPDMPAVILASPKARHFARSQQLSLSGIPGSGPRGMIVLDDLQKAARLQPERIKATPLARRMAAESGVELQGLSGSGPRGAVTRSDVEQALSRQPSPAPSAPGVTAVPAPSGLSGTRAGIAERLAASWQERPQVTLISEIDVTNLVSARKQFQDENGAKLSYNAFILLAAARALQQFPQLNASLTRGQYVQHANIDLGLAVDTERGLFVPVLRNVDQKSVFTINREIADLAQRTQSGQLSPEEMKGSTFTVTNLGAYGVDAFTPLINPPETAILGVGRIMARAVVLEGQLVARDTVTLSLSFDHRLVDGAPAARFLQRLAQYLERPVVLVSA